MKINSFMLLIALGLLGCEPRTEIKPQRRNMVDAVFGSGHLEHAGQYTVVANTEGYLTAAYVAEGDTVSSAQPLFGLSNGVQQTQVDNARTDLDYAQTKAQPGSPPIQQVQIQLEQARHKVAVDSANYARYSRLVKTQAVSTSDFENAQLAYQNAQSNLSVWQKNLADLRQNLNLNVVNAGAQYRIQQQTNRYYTLTSKDAGVVMNIGKKIGDFVRKGDVMTLLATGKIVIKLAIAEDDIGRVKVGQRTLISLNTKKDSVYEARITRVYPAFSTTDQSFMAEAAFTAGTPAAWNGTQLQANIIVQEKKDALVIPSYCLLDNNYVLIKNEKRPVSVGIRTLEWTEITGGLTQNDVLTSPKQPQS